MCEWLGELWHVRESAPSIYVPWRFCFGSIPDAWFIMRHATGADRRDILQSPWSCLFILFGAMIAPALTAIRLSGSRSFLDLASHTDAWPFLSPFHFQVPTSSPSPVDQQILLVRLTLILSLLVLAALNTNFHFALPARKRSPRAVTVRFRWGAFLFAKFVLIVPLVFLSALDAAQMFGARQPVSLFAEMAVCLSGFSFLFRWAVGDQRLRCPECMSRVRLPVEIGSPSRILVDPQVTEYVCPQDHGFLQVDHATVYDLPRSRWIGAHFHLN